MSGRLNEVVDRIFENTLFYDGNSSTKGVHLGKTIAGGAGIFLLKVLGAPSLIETGAWLFTLYQGYKTFRDYNA